MNVSAPDLGAAHSGRSMTSPEFLRPRDLRPGLLSFVPSGLNLRRRNPSGATDSSPVRERRAPETTKPSTAAIRTESFQSVIRNENALHPPDFPKPAQGQNHPMFQKFSEGGPGDNPFSKGFPPEILAFRNKSAWAVKDLYMGHFAVADLTGKRFFHTEVISREGPGLAAASEDDLNVRIRNWSAERTGQTFRIRAADKAVAVDLTLKPVKQPVLHGDQGFSRKGDSATQASYYYSLTRLEAAGTLTVNGTPTQVNGLVWMDHEFASSILTAEQAGWDWFGLQLDDGSELMAFQLRKSDGTFEQPFCTFVDGDGTASPLSGTAISITRTGPTWKSHRSGAVYPAGWTIDVPARALKIDVTPAPADQELNTAKSTQVTYWEGAVHVSGQSRGRPVQGRGYVELTGYAHSMGGRL
ncbi:MAG: lipocalin family protein [Thermodesulfobacteriota bacterium]